MSDASVMRRRIQRLGGSSLIITIPKSWARKIGLKVGDDVVIVNEGDHLRIYPPDSRLIQVAESTKIRIPWYLRGDPLSLLINCLYSKGYKRLLTPLPSPDSPEGASMVGFLKSHPKVEASSIGYSDLVLELRSNDAGSPARLLKLFNSKLVGMLEAVIGGAGAEDIEGEVEEAVDLVRLMSKAVRRQGLVFCDVDAVDPAILSSLAALPRLIPELARHYVKGDRELEELLDKTRFMLSELIGGIASGSGRRIINALNQAEALSSEARSMAREGGKGALAGIVLSITHMVRPIVESAICLATIEG